MIIDLNKHRPDSPESVMGDIYSLVNTGEDESIFCMLLTVSIFPYFKDTKRNEWFYKQWWIIDLPF